MGGQGQPGYSLTDAGEGGDEDGGLHVAGVNGEDAHEAADDADAHEQHVHVSPSQREDGQNRGTYKHTIDTTHTTSIHNTYITVPKVGILNFCSGFRWTAVLVSVQRNPLTNAITLQSIPLFWRFFCSEFRCKALDSTIKYLKHSDLAVDSALTC